MKDALAPSVSTSLRAIGLILLGIVLGFGAGFFIANSGQQLPSSQFRLPQEALELLDSYYIGDLPPSIDLQRGMTRGLLDSLDDPNTTYLDPVTHELEQQTLRGAYGGIGAFLSLTDRGWILIPFEDGPAAGAGVQEADLLLHVDETAINTKMPETDVAAALRGEAGSTAKIEVLREGEGRLTFQIVRQDIPIPSASSYMHPQAQHIGVLKLTAFGTPTAAEVRKNLDKLQEDGAAGIILDLRGNPGGLLDSALTVADIFLADGIIVSELAYDGTEVEHRASFDPEDVNLPLVVMIDGATASGAEVLAAALRDNNRALLVGDSTFGKGSVQTIYDLSDGSSLHITTSRWYRPLGEAIGQNGISPDLAIEAGTGSEDPSLQAALDILLPEVEANQ